MSRLILPSSHLLEIQILLSNNYYEKGAFVGKKVRLPVGYGVGATNQHVLVALLPSYPGNTETASVLLSTPYSKRETLEFPAGFSYSRISPELDPISGINIAVEAAKYHGVAAYLLGLTINNGELSVKNDNPAVRIASILWHPKNWGPLYQVSTQVLGMPFVLDKRRIYQKIIQN